MEKSNDERLLDLRALVRGRLQRDLRELSTIVQERNELSLAELLEEVHNVYVHYVKLGALLDNVSAAINKSDPKLQEELRKLRAIDGN